MAYELKIGDIRSFARSQHCDTREKDGELFFRYCPYCQGGERKDKESFSINLENGTFKCFRTKCGMQGHFVELARDFKYPLDFGFAEKKYRKLPQVTPKSKPKAIEYLQGRGIGEEIAKRYRITTHKSNENILVFPFYDEYGKLEFVKYRNAKPKQGQSKEWCEKDTKPILFGMEQCVNFERLVITEGQIDSLSLSECGIENAVSVPTGANGFTWVNHVWDWIIKFEVIVVFGDYENGKITLLDELLNRLPNRIMHIDPACYLGEKDANAILQKFGKEAIIKAVENPVVRELESIKRLADVKKVDLDKLPKITTGINALDKVIGGLYLGQLVVLTGKRGEGKSTFMSQIICEALEQGYHTLAYSGELPDYYFKNWIDLQLAGPDNVSVSMNRFGDESFYLEQSVVDQINDWYRDKAFIYDNSFVDDYENEHNSLIHIIESAVRQYDIKLVCVDNLMTAIGGNLEVDLYRCQSIFARKLKKIADKYNIVVILVAHPRKSGGKFSNDDVAGSADITNVSDLTINYSRTDKDDCTADSVIQVTKNRLKGVLDDNIKTTYSKSSKRIVEIGKDSGDRVYGWNSEPVERNDIATPFDAEQEDWFTKF